jgi:hypothetical protein
MSSQNDQKENEKEAVHHAGIEKVWTTVRRRNNWYVPNKVISFMIATTLAGFTLSYKQLVYEYQQETKDYNYTIIYWFLFIYYSFQALDELIELYSVIAQREKGALGLLFEMNYFLGIATFVYVMWALYHNPLKMDEAHDT